MKEKRKYVPTMNDYKQALGRLIDAGAMTELVAVRLGCECGMTRLEIVNAKLDCLDQINKRGLWIDVAKKVYHGHALRPGKKRKKPQMIMRVREVPINLNLYQLLRVYCENSEVFILHRERGDASKPFHVDMIDKWYYNFSLLWSSHKSRHFFKSQVWAWMMKNHRPDDAVLKEMMGHAKDTHESYGVYPWDYKLEIVDGVFQ